MRKTYEELRELQRQYKTDRLWSWSRVNCVHNSLYEYYLKYVAHEKEDRQDSIYVVTGGIAHDIIEKFYSGELSKEQMLEEFNDGWTTAFDIGELKFNRSDSEKNNNIADKYYKNLEHFFTNHVVIDKNIALEQFVSLKLGEEYYQGYIDALTTDDDGNYIIIDWKTSSIYLGDKAKNECGQLVMYAIALNQKGIPFDKIKICWNFLKYVNVVCAKPRKVNLTWTTVKGETKTKEKLDFIKVVSTLKASAKAWLKEEGYGKEIIDSYIEDIEKENSIYALPESVWKYFSIEDVNEPNEPRRIERCKIGESLQANVKSWMKKLGYSEDEIFESIDMLVQTNDIKCLPDDVQDKYEISDCYVYVDLTDELLKHWEDYIVTTTKMLRDKEAEYAKTKDESIWMESQEDIAANSFYFANLCAYSANKHKPYKMYLASLEKEKDGNILIKNKNTDEYDENDLSWLNDLD